MILAAPLVIPFAEIIGVSIAALGMSKATDEVNKYIEANPEQSMKIFQMIMPSQGIANILKNKSSDEEVEEDVEVEEVDTRDLTRAEKAKMMKELAKSGGGNMREKMKKGYEEIIQPGESDRELDDAEDRYDGGVEDAPKPKFDYKKFFKKRYADGGSAGIASMMPFKKIKGQDHILAYITPKEADKLVALGGKETMTKEGILAYPEFDNYGYSSQQDFDQGNYGRSNDPTVSSYAGGNNLTDQTNVNKKITEEINKKLNELKPPVIDYTKQKFDNLEKFRTLKKSPISFAPFRFERPKNINKTLFDSTISELALSYPDLDITNEFGTVNTDNLKTAIDSAVLKGDLSPIDGLTLTQSITTQGDPSSIGLSYDNNLVNFSTPNINEGDYTLGTNYQIGDLGVGSMFDVKNDSLAKKNLSFNYGDGTLKGSQVTYPGSNFQTNELGLNKNFNVTDNIDVNVKGDLSNVKLDGGTLYTDKSLTPTVTFNKNIGDGSISLSGSKEIIDGGSIPNVNFSGSYPLSNNSQIGLTTDNLLSKDRTGNLSYTKNIGNYGDNTFLDASAEVNPFNPEEYTGMLKLYSKFSDGGRVGLFMGGSPLEGQALSIYDSMKAYNFSDQEIANALSAQGLYTAGGSTPEIPDTPVVQQLGYQGGNGGGGGITALDPLNRPKGTPFDLNSLTKTKFGYNNALGRTIEGVKDFTGSMIDKFSGSKIGEGITSGATKFKNMAFTPMMALMQKRNPLNPSATNYNPNLQKQMDFLEGTTGTRVFGTSDNLQFEDAAMIGRDPNSGLAKYGPGSVLSGQNVVSGFGTNDYEQQLANYISKMRTYKNLTNFQKEKLEQAKAEVAKEIARREQETADRARAANPGVYASADRQGFTDGKGGGFGSKSTGTNDAFSNESGRGRTGYKDGGLVTMFKEKR